MQKFNEIFSLLIFERIPFSVKGIWSELARIERSPVRVASPAGAFKGRNTSSPKNACGGGYGTGGHLGFIRYRGSELEASE